jgi:outer membrane protein assembly factor BamB
MTNDQLIELLAAKTPEELTPEEIDLVRSRLADSPELQQALASQLELDSQLSAALAQVSLSADDIVERARQQAPSPLSSFAWAGILLVALPLIVLVGAVLWQAAREPREVANNRQPEVTDNPAAPGNEPKQNGAAAANSNSPPDSPPGAKSRNPLAEAIRRAQGKPPQESLPAQRDPTQLGRPGSPPPAVAVPAAPPPPPWQAALDPALPATPFREVAFEPFDTRKTMPQREELRQWLAEIPGQRLEIRSHETRRGPCVRFDGIARLAAPWPEGVVWRLSLEDHNRLQVHFYDGQQGATFVYYADQNDRWTVYATTRKANEPRPATWAQTGTDDDRGRRSELRQGGPLEFRYLDGEIVLSRGDIVLTSAPLAGPPADVVLEGRAVFEGISLIRTDGAPERRPALGEAIEAPPPAEWNWQVTRQDLGKVEKLTGGGVRFSASNAAERAHAFAPLPENVALGLGLHEVTMELEAVEPGAGVYLAYEDGQAYEVIRLVRDRRSQQLVAVLRGWDDEWERDFDPATERPTAFVAPHCWIKLLYGCGNLRWWISADGVHWAQPEMAHDGVRPQPLGIGVQLVARRPSVGLTVKNISVRRLSALASLAGEDLLARGKVVTSAPTLGAWLAEILPEQPADISADDWRRASAIRSLVAGMHRDQAYPLLEALLDELPNRVLPLDRQMAILEEATLVCRDLRDGGTMRKGIPRRMQEAGLDVADREGLYPWSSVRLSMMSSPWATHLVSPLELERIIRSETIARAYRGDPAESIDFVRTLRLFSQDRYSPLVDWLQAQAARQLPGGATGDSRSLIKDGWRSPLVEELSKEIYNATTELQSLLDSEAWDEAARAVTALDRESSAGVSPYLQDRNLLVSLPIAVRLTLEDYPQVAGALRDNLSSLGKLRVSQATASGDVETVRLATVQFAGTDAAAEAHAWLGDRALAGGAFEQAIHEYRQASTQLPSLAPRLAPRIRLAAAMLGRDEGEPATAPVELQSATLAPAEFEAIVAEMRTRPDASILAQGATSQAAVDALPDPRQYRAQMRSRLDGPVGERPEEEVGGRRTNQFRVSWPDRQLATVREGETLYVNNRFQVAAYHLSDGRRLWQSEAPPGAMQRAQEWALTAMRPLITRERIFARQLYSDDPQLVCWEKASGKRVWTRGAPGEEFFVSDPVVVQGQLGAFSIGIQEQQGQLRWNLFDPLTGELIAQRNLLRLLNTWGKRSCCEVAVVDDTVVAVLGGITLSLDAAGNLRWIRQHLVIPADEDPQWVLQQFAPPLVDEGRMYVAQPGVRTVEAIDPATGRQHWSVALPEVLGLVGLTRPPAGAGMPRLIVRTERDLRGLDLDTGETVWRFATNDMTSHQLVDGRAIVLAQRERIRDQNDERRMRLIWLDPMTGHAQATSVIADLVDNDPRLGPLVAAGERIFAFFGRGQHDARRDIVELVPEGDADRAEWLAAEHDPWRQRIPRPLSSAAATLLPDWQLLSGEAGDRTGIVSDVHGQHGVLGIRSTGAWPILLGRQVPSAERPSRLRLHLATDGGQIWKVKVRLGALLVADMEVTDASHPDRWKTLDIDLQPVGAPGEKLEGSAWLTIRAQSKSGDHVLWIQRAELVP